MIACLQSVSPNRVTSKTPISALSLSREAARQPPCACSRAELRAVIALILVGVLFVAGCGGKAQNQDKAPSELVSPEGLVVFLHSTEWTGIGSGKGIEVKGSRQLLKNDIVGLYAVLHCAHTNSKPVKVPHNFRLVGTTNGVTFYNKAVDVSTSRDNGAGLLKELAPDEGLEIRLESDYEDYQTLCLQGAKFSLQETNCAWSWPLPDLPHHDALFTEGCLHKLKVKLNSQIWSGMRPGSKVVLVEQALPATIDSSLAALSLTFEFFNPCSGYVTLSDDLFTIEDSTGQEFVNLVIDGEKGSLPKTHIVLNAGMKQQISFTSRMEDYTNWMKAPNLVIRSRFATNSWDVVALPSLEDLYRQK